MHGGKITLVENFICLPQSYLKKFFRGTDCAVRPHPSLISSTSMCMIVTPILLLCIATLRDIIHKLEILLFALWWPYYRFLVTGWLVTSKYGSPWSKGYQPRLSWHNTLPRIADKGACTHSISLIPRPSRMRRRAWYTLYVYAWEFHEKGIVKQFSFWHDHVHTVRICHIQSAPSE